MWRDAAVIAAKDLRIELRSRVTTYQVAPLAVLILVLFAFALDPESGLLRRAAPGLYWIAVLFAAVLAVQRAFSIETSDGNCDGLRLSGLLPGGIFLGKVGALMVQLVVLEAVLALGAALFYNVSFAGTFQLGVTALLATVGIAAAGVLYGVLTAGAGVRDTLLPLLLLPVLAPVLIAGTRAFQAALSGSPSEGRPWIALIALFAVVYLGAGVVAFGPLLEET